MEQIKIINQTTPRRCEICHQSDQFEPNTGKCLRCSNITPSLQVQQLAYPKTAYAPFPVGIWRDNDILIMHKNATLPDRCIKCGDYTNGLRLKKNLRWFSPYYYLLLLVNSIVFIVVASIASKRATVEFPICPKHHESRNKAMMISWAVIGAGILSMFLIRYETIFLLIGILVLFTGLISIIVTSKVVDIKKIDDQHVWLKGVNKTFLEQFINTNNR